MTIEQFIRVLVVLVEFPEPLSFIVESSQSNEFSISQSQEPLSTRSVTIESRVRHQ